MRRDEPCCAAVRERPVVVAVEAQPRDGLEQRLDIRFGAVAAVAGSCSIESRLNRGREARSARRHDRRVQDKRPTGGALGSEAAVFLEARDAETEVDSRQSSRQRRDDLRKRGPHDRAVRREAAGVIEQQEHVGQVRNTTGTGQCQGDGLAKLLVRRQRCGDAGRRDDARCQMARAGWPERAIGRGREGLLVTR